MKPMIGLLLILSACGPSANDPGPGGVSVEDARALDAAAEKLDAQAGTLSTPPTAPAAPQKQK